MTNAAVPSGREPKCDHICRLDEGHVERGEIHQYGYELPSPREEYTLAGYFRFVESDKPGVVGEVISTFRSDWADPSDVPVYRKRGETKRTREG